MFSVYPRSEYTHDKAIRTENLTDVLGHAGIDVAWWDNDLGSKSVANRLQGYRQYYTAHDPEFCKGENVSTPSSCEIWAGGSTASAATACLSSISRAAMAPPTMIDIPKLSDGSHRIAALRSSRNARMRRS